VHLAADGTELSRVDGFNGPLSVSVNPKDGSCWVADTANNRVVLLAADGTWLWWGGEFYGPTCVSANPTDGSCWVADRLNSQVVHLIRSPVPPPSVPPPTRSSAVRPYRRLHRASWQATPPK
jgi:DNA-binding beta-propeller fold protein YncE